MAISMRHSKLTAAEAAKLAGEVQKPNWESKNEGIHERVSFEDSIWGFDLAGGSFYKTPLRVVGVKPGSRAEKAGIRPGDRLKRINDIETSTLTIQEAHEIIIESGVHLKLAVTAPDDEEDAYFCYQDPLQENGYDSDEERRLAEERAKKREVHAKVSSYWSLQWPWVSKRRIIYRESNCFMVPSKYEGKNRTKFPVQPMIIKQDDIVLQKAKNENELPEVTKNDKLQNGLPKTNTVQSIVNGQDVVTNGMDLNENLANGAKSNIKENGVKALPGIPEKEEESIQEEASEVDNDGFTETEIEEESIHQEILEEEEVSELESEIEEKSHVETSEATENHEEVLTSESTDIHEELINEVLESHDISKEEEDSIVDSILSDSEANSTNER